MFRKKENLVEKSRTLLKNKEIRGLRTWILQEYPNLGEAALEEALPAKASVTCIKLTNNTLLYSINNLVYFFDLHGEKKVLLPSLLMLWKCPDMMRTMRTHGPVSRFILRGADFMAPGLASLAGLDGLMKGDKVCLVSSRNPLPFAVGLSLIDIKGTSVGKQGLQGKAMQVLHYYGDCLLPEMRPNEGFTLTEILAVARAGGAEVAESDDDGDDEQADAKEDCQPEGDHDGLVTSQITATGEDGIGLSEVSGVADVSNQSSDTAEAAAVSDQAQVAESWEDEDLATAAAEVSLGNDHDGVPLEDQQEQDAASGDDEEEGVDLDIDIGNNMEEEADEAHEDIEAEAPAATSSSVLSAREQVDLQLERAVSLAVRYVVKSAALPLLLSSFWKTLLRCHSAAELCDRPPSSSGTPSPAPFLNVKHSSFRKPLAFATYCAQQGLLVLEGAAGDGAAEAAGDLAVVSVNKDHAWVRRHKVASLELFRQFLRGDAEEAAGKTAAAGIAVPLLAKPAKGAKYVVQDLYKVPKKLRELLLVEAEGQVTGEYGDTLKLSEVRELLLEFIRREGLEEGANKGEIVLKADKHAALLSILGPSVNSASKGGAKGVDMTSKSSQHVSESDGGGGVSDARNKVPDDDEDFYAAEDDDEPPASFSTGLALPPTLPSAPMFTLKIREGGLIDVNSLDKDA
eukprot:gene27255-32925_t